jgi:pimeloyl-ACP methyl ester carboxylesterase
MECLGEVNYDRRGFLRNSTIALAAAGFAPVGAAFAQSRSQNNSAPAKSNANTAFASLKQINAGVLDVGYAEDGPATGPVVILLHGWPYDIHSFVDVVPILAAAGYRVIVPYLRGYGTTRFLSGETLRNGQPAAVAVDAITLMDALKIGKATLAGFDWGARTADIIAALWPERCRALVSVSGYLIGSPATEKAPLPPKVELQWWYQYYFATERGQTTQPLIAARRHSIIRITSRSPFTTIVGDSDSHKVRLSMTTSTRNWLQVHRSPCPQSLLKATPMARRTRSPAFTRTSSPANMNTA